MTTVARLLTGISTSTASASSISRQLDATVPRTVLMRARAQVTSPVTWGATPNSRNPGAMVSGPWYSGSSSPARQW